MNKLRERERESKNLKQETKQSLIESLELERNAGSLEPTNFQLLEKLINNADSIDEAISIRSLGLTFKNTGLYYQQKLEKKQSEMIHYLKKNDKMSFDQGGIKHKLIIGDNYHALLNLLITHKGKIDVIYIDPPYGCDSMGQFADTNYENNITRDNLLSMLEPRLRLANQLLSNEGVIFCSIDDKNQAYLKLLFDEIFGENNFIATLIWHARRGGGNDVKHIAVDHEYILAYSKRKEECLLTGKMKTDDAFKLSDEFVATRGKYNLQQFDWASLTYTISLDYPIVAPDKTVIYPGHVEENEWKKRKENKSKRNDWRWMMSEETFKKAKANGFIIFEKKKDQWNVRVKTYQLIDYKMQNKDRVLKLRSILNSTNTQDGRKALELLEIKSFDYPKPVKLICELLESFNKKDAIILDFFAGSGTTAQSVIECNNLDGGKRQFILATINEKDDRNPNGIACDTTYPRIKKIINTDSLNVYKIKETNNLSEKIFNEINPEDYEVKDKTTIKNRIEWICENFEVTCSNLEEKQ